MASLRIVLVLRVLRLLRLLRTLRMLPFFGTLWKFVSALSGSVAAIFSTVALLLMVLYMAACLAIEVIAKDSMLRSMPQTREIIDVHFHSLDTVMLSFVQFVTMDSISAMYFPLIEQRGYLSIFFFLLILVVSIALMNIVTAYTVEIAISSTIKDREMQEEEMRLLRPDLIKAFEMMDMNHDQFLTIEEVMAWRGVLPPRVVQALPQDKMVALFDMLDMDNSGSVDQDEFVDCVAQLAIDGVAFTTLQLLRLLTQVKIGQERHLNELLCLHTKFKHLEKSCKKSDGEHHHTEPLQPQLPISPRDENPGNVWV